MVNTYKKIRSFTDKLSENSVGAYSAQAAFFVITSFFPFMLLLVNLLQFTPLNAANIQEWFLDDTINTVTGEMLSGVIREVSAGATGTLLGAAGLSAIWAASRCLLSIIQGLNKVYSCENERGWLKLRLLSVVYIVVLQLMLIVSLGVLVFGEQLSSRFRLLESIVNMRWLIGLSLLVGFFVMIYTFVPNRKTRLSKELPGAVLSSIGWLAFTAIFSSYISRFSDFGAVYGSLTAAVILMLWLYFCMYILFLGAQFNVTLHNKSISKVTVKQFINRGKTP
jgi:membrane protein